MKTISPRSARAQKHPLMYPTLVNAHKASAWPRVTRFEIGKHTHLKCAGNLRNLTILIVAFWRFIFRRSPLSFLWTICVPLLGWPTPSAEWFGKMERDWMVMVYLLFKAWGSSRAHPQGPSLLRWVKSNKFIIVSQAPRRRSLEVCHDWTGYMQHLAKLRMSFGEVSKIHQTPGWARFGWWRGVLDDGKWGIFGFVWVGYFNENLNFNIYQRFGLYCQSESKCLFELPESVLHYD